MEKNFGCTRIPKPLTSRQSFATISIEDEDRLRLVYFTDTEIRAIENFIRVSWHKPIEVSDFIPKSNPVAYEIKLTGGPWSCSTTSSDSILSCVLIRDLLVHLYSQGWFISSLDLSFRNFRAGEKMMFLWTPTDLPKREWLAIKFAKRGHLRFIGELGDKGFGSLIEGIQAQLKDLGYIQTEKAATSKNLKNLKNPGNEERVAVTMLLVRLLEILDRFGWSVYATLGQNIFGHDEKYFLGVKKVYQRNTWYCFRQVN